MRSSTRPRADLLVSILLLLVIATFTLAAIEVTNETSARVRCASHLRQIAQAMLLYSNDNNGAFPRTKYDPEKGPWWGTPYGRKKDIGPAAPDVANPFAKDSPAAPEANDVTAALWLLVRTQDITTDVFVCPATGQTRFDYGGGANRTSNWTNWPGDKGLRDHLSYSVANPYPKKSIADAGYRWDNSLSAEFALAADMNPGADTLNKLTVNSSPLAMTLGNSINHDRAGQNILYGDGHVAWEPSPFVGIERDNIYTYGESGESFPDKSGMTGANSPQSRNDSILLPLAINLDIVDPEGAIKDDIAARRKAVVAAYKDAPPVDAEAIRKRLIGRYVRIEADQLLTLDITQDSITAAGGPVTVKFNYRIERATDNDGVYAILNAPNQSPALASISLTKDGVYVWQGRQADGSWKRH